MNEYKVIGLMSGTSLDGVDVAFCVFKEISGKWDFEIVKAETFPYENYWIKKLKNLHSKDALTFVK
ncbi:MAG: anhydro-N-acetylmuramic acid kinase, partial [Bacteroidales bacterium]|nr:anhydro-N-acetylmuramic acid kinase [Bacteroidales bacterium]